MEDEDNQYLFLDEGRIYLESDLIKKFFPDIKAVAVIIHDQSLKIFPIYEGVGGYLLKVRNLKGDCVVEVYDVLASHGLSHCKKKIAVKWSSKEYSLVVDLVEILHEVEG